MGKRVLAGSCCCLPNYIFVLADSSSKLFVTKTKLIWELEIGLIIIILRNTILMEKERQSCLAFQNWKKINDKGRGQKKKNEIMWEKFPKWEGGRAA